MAIPEVSRSHPCCFKSSSPVLEWKRILRHPSAPENDSIGFYLFLSSSVESTWVIELILSLSLHTGLVTV